MFGKNKILQPVTGDGLNLDVTEIFPTVQGEGPYVGHPAVFIRLSGCNLACKFCDTEFDSYKNYSLKNLLTEIKELAKNEDGDVVRKLIVITGGEPFRQPFEKLCEELVKLGFLVQIETNGTLYRKQFDELLGKEKDKIKIICSPKAVNGKYYKVRPDLLPHINAFKFIISANDKNYFDVADVGQKEFQIPIYVQPMDEYDEDKNKANIKRVLSLSQQHGYLISLQTHKMLEVR